MSIESSLRLTSSYIPGICLLYVILGLQGGGTPTG